MPGGGVSFVVLGGRGEVYSYVKSRPMEAQLAW